MRKILNFNSKWAFTKQATEIPAALPMDWVWVNLPHSWNAIDGQDGDNDYFRGTLIVTDIWKGAGWASILYLAAISGIDPSLYEAAKCDGATKLQCTRYITLPCIAATITVMLILEIGGILDAGFDQVFNLYNSAVYETADIIDTYVYRLGIEQAQYSVGTAIGLFKSLVSCVLVLISYVLADKVAGYRIF